MPFTMTNRIPIHEQNRELASSKKDDERKQIKKYVTVQPKPRNRPFSKIRNLTWRLTKPR
jgi:hypothetical protein